MLMLATSLIAACGELLKFESAVIVIVTAGILVLAKMVSDLRGEVRELRRAQSEPKPGTTGAASGRGAGIAAGPPAPEEIPADVYAAIVAAVHYTLGHEHHPISVSPVESLMWSREGRRNIFSSHSFR